MKRSSSSSKDSTTASKEAATVLKGVLEASELPSFILVTAPDLIRLRRVEERCREKLSAKGMQVVKLRGDELTQDALLRFKDELATLSLFAGPRLYVLQYLEKIPAASAKLLSQLLTDSIPETTVLGLAGPLPASDPLVQRATKLGTYAKFPELAGAELTKWSAREAALAGLSACPPAVLERIIELADQRPDTIAELIGHLALYLDGSPATLESLSALFPSHAVAGEFELVDAIAAGSIARAEILFETLLRAGKSPFMLLGMISKIFSNYHLIATMVANRVPPNAIREELKMAPWVFDKSIDAARRIRPSEVESQLAAIVRADSKLKNKSLGPEAIFSELFESLKPTVRGPHA